MNKSFKGMLADGEIQQIRLSTNNGLTGYKIVKFEIIANKSGTTDFEHTVQIYTQDPETATESVEFNNPLLLAVAFTEGNNSSNYIGQPLVTIFDNATFNQDIFISHVDTKGALLVNYYLELEQITLSKDEATVATLKDMRASE